MHSKIDGCRVRPLFFLAGGASNFGAVGGGWGGGGLSGLSLKAPGEAPAKVLRGPLSWAMSAPAAGGLEGSERGVEGGMEQWDEGLPSDDEPRWEKQWGGGSKNSKKTVCFCCWPP